MLIRSMRDRYPDNSPERRIYDRFQKICAELSEDVDPISSHRAQASLTASSGILCDAAIAMLEADSIPREDWDIYLDCAFRSGNPRLLEAALRLMPLGCKIESIHSIIQNLVRTAPIRHILLATEAGIGDLCLTKTLVQATIIRQDTDLDDAILAHVESGGASFSMQDWFAGLRVDSLRKARSSSAASCRYMCR